MSIAVTITDAATTKGTDTMTLTANTTWTVSPTDAYADYMDRCQVVAEAIGFDFNPLLGTFYNASGGLTNHFNVGYMTYYAGLHRDELVSHEMKMGFDEAHGENQFGAAMAEDEDSYRNEPGFAESGRWF